MLVVQVVGDGAVDGTGLLPSKQLCNKEEVGT